MKKTEREYLNRVAEAGCQLCHEAGYPDTPAQVHHIREGQGMGQRADNQDVLPLCYPGHHKDGAERRVVGFHDNPRLWRDTYGTEREVLARFLARLNGTEGE